MKPVRFLLRLEIILFLTGCALDHPDIPKNAQQEVSPNLPPHLIKQRFHIEVEPRGQAPQVFYDLDKSKFKNPIFIKKTILIKGKTQGAAKYISRDNEPENTDIGSNFSDIIAIPMANKTKYLIPKLPITQTRVHHDEKFILELLADTDYLLILNPQGKYQRPPFFAKIQANSQRQIIFDVAAYKTYLSGQVFQNKNKALKKNTAQKLQAALYQGTRLASIIAPLDTDGSFKLEISPGYFLLPTNAPLVLKISPQDPIASLPTVKKLIRIESILNKNNTNNINIGEIKNNIKKTFILTNSSNIAGEIVLQSKIHLREIKIRKTIGDSSTTTFNVQPGKYSLAVIPERSSPYALYLEPDLLLEAKNADIFRLNLDVRPSLKGKILDDKNKALKGARVEFSRIGELGKFASAEIFDHWLFKLTASTNDQGQICHQIIGKKNSPEQENCPPLTLDPGRYVAQITPPAGSMLPRYFDIFDFPLKKYLQIKLSPSGILRSKVYSAHNNKPIANAFVTVYVAQKQGIAQVIGTDLTDNLGQFEIMVGNSK